MAQPGQGPGTEAYEDQNLDLEEFVLFPTFYEY